MARIPIAVLLILGVGFGWQFVFFDQALPTFEPSGQLDDPNNSSEETFGFLSSFMGLVNAVWDAVVLFASLLTFSLVDGPSSGTLAVFWDVFKWTFRLTVVGSLLWAVVSLARGA